MKLLPFLISLCLFYNSFAQNQTNTSLDNICQYKTDGTGKSLGLKIKIDYPCSWQIVDGQRPHVIKSFLNGSDINSGRVQFVFGVNSMPTILTEDEIDKMFTQDYLKESVSDWSTFISGKKVKIDGQHTSEVECKMTRETPLGLFYSYNIVYQIFYKDKIITLNYGVGSSSNEKALAMFEENKTLFKVLVTRTIITSKWE